MITTDALSAQRRGAIESLLTAVIAHDGISPLDEAARLALRGEGATHLLIEDGAAVTGYASLLEDGTLQGMVDPSRRRAGLGTELLAAVLERRPDAGVWAHGALPGAVALLEGQGLRQERLLLVLRRPLDAEHPLPPVPATDLPGVEVTSFVAERDAEDWVALNAAAFASHPEQGALTREDLDERLAEPWFDPEDMVLARTPEGLAGFVWVKREETADAEVPDPNTADAEIYVVATAPSAQGHGVAGHLLGTALRRLAELRVPGVELYVEGDNAPALALYERWGFGVSGRHLQLRRATEG